MSTKRADLAGMSGSDAAAFAVNMRQIIEEWVLANRNGPASDQLGELVRHLDAAPQAAISLARAAA